MNLCNDKGSMSTASSGVVVSDQFPVGLRVLVVDDDPTCLRILEKMLRTCLYEVTKCNRAETALNLLRGNKNGYDIVISDVHMPDIDGFKLLEQVGLEMDLPVIMMSADDSKHVVMEGVTHGACDYLIKPVRIEALKNIWQHVVRKRKNEWKDLEQSGSVEEGDRQPKPSEEADYSSSVNERNWRNSKRRKDEEEEAEERDDTSTLKKPRVVWSVELHQQFVSAVSQLGIDKAVPKKILELMNVPGLTRENVASHLQKYRLYLRRLNGVSQHQGNSFIGPQEPPYGPLSQLNGLDIQALAATGQIPAQSLATLQVAGLGRSTAKPGLSMPLVDQRSLFSFDNQKIRFGEGQPQYMNSGKQMNLLHGIPTTMEPKQIVNLHHSAPSLGGMNMPVDAHEGHSSQSSSLLMQMTQQQSRAQILNETNGGQVPRLPTSMGQPILSNGVGGGMLARNGISENGRGTGYNSVSRTTSMLSFPLNPTVKLPGNSFPEGSTPGISAGMSTITTKGGFQQEVDSDVKGSGALMPSYDIFNDLQQHKPHNNWELQDVGLTFDASQHSNSLQSNVDVANSVLINQAYSSSQRSGQSNNASLHSNTLESNVDVATSVLINQAYSSSQRSGQSNNASQHSNSLQSNVDVATSALINQAYSSSQRSGQSNNASVLGKAMFSAGEGSEHWNAQNVGQHVNNLLVDNSMPVKAKRFSDTSCPPTLFPQHFGQEDLMSALLKQQGGIGPAENEFEFDGYSLDNIPV